MTKRTRTVLGTLQKTDKIYSTMKLLSLLLLRVLYLAQTSAARTWYPLGNWIEEEGENDIAGHAVANSGNGKFIAVSSPHYVPPDANGKRYGRVVVYGFDEIRDAWDKQGDDIVGEADDALGSSMAMSEDGKSLIIGMKNNNLNGDPAGTVSVYILEEVDENGNGTKVGAWKQKGVTLQGAYAFDEFGASVDIAAGGQIIAVGAPGHDRVNADASKSHAVGVVHIYKFASEEVGWEKVGEPVEGEEAMDRFGETVSMSQLGVFAVGAPNGGLSQTGYVQVFAYNATASVWVYDGFKLNGSQVGERFGTSVSMSYDGMAVAVGAPRHKGTRAGVAMTHSGIVHVYDLVAGTAGTAGTKTWVERGEGLAGHAGDESGTAVSLSDDGNELAIGSPMSSTAEHKESGHVAVYYYVDEKWETMGLDINGKSAYNHLGESVAISANGHQVIAGAPDEGYATVYELTLTASPTSSPTAFPQGGEPDGAGTGGKSGPSKFTSFVRFVLIVAVIVFGLFAAFKGVQAYRNKGRSFQAPSDLEMSDTVGEGGASGAVPNDEGHDII